MRSLIAKLPNISANERVVFDVDSRVARRLGALALILSSAWLVVLLERDHHHANWQADGRLAWSLTLLAAVALIARGIYLGRPVTAAHSAAAAGAVVAGIAIHLVSFDLAGDVVIASAGLALMWPTSARQRPDELVRVWPLVDATAGIRAGTHRSHTGRGSRSRRRHRLRMDADLGCR